MAEPPVYRLRTSILEVPHEFKPRRGSSALWQGALSSFAKSVGPVYRRVTPMHVKEPTSLLAKEQGEILVKWSASQTYGNRCMMSTPRGSP